MSHYTASLRDIEFCLFDLLEREKVLGTSVYADIDRETAMGMLEEVKRIVFCACYLAMAISVPRLPQDESAASPLPNR